jgi:hypothetical protein
VNEYGDRPPYLLNSIRRRHLDVCHEVWSTLSTTMQSNTEHVGHGLL